jgi:hypothetical protein
MNTVIDLLAEEAELHDGVEGHACAVVSIKDNDGFVADTRMPTKTMTARFSFW